METVKTNSIKAWLLAARPKTLAGAAVPVMLGCALAAADGWFQIVPAILCFLFAFLMQIDANFINDFFDYLKGSDREDRLGPERACAQGWITLEAMKRGIALTTMLACVVGALLLFYSGAEMIPVGLLCILFAFLYTAGPYPLAYHGWGDVLVIIFFGFVPVGCTYYVMCHDWTWNVTIASVVCGMIIDTLLMVNNYRDREQDALSGKKTLVVRCRQRTYMGSNTTTNLYSSPFPDLATNGENQQRQRAEHHIGRNLAQHAVIRDITDLGIDFMRWRKTR